MGIKCRILPILLWNEHGCVKGKQFNSGRCIGSIQDRIQLLERREVDELILLDISATPNERGPRFQEIAKLCDALFMPVTVGGGIKSIPDIKRLLAEGADKVAIGTMAFTTPNLIDDAASKFGSQAIVVSIDVKGGTVWTHCGQKNSGRDPVEYADEMESRGAGEILLTSIERDGMLQGYDLELIESVAMQVSIPVIAAGGCGEYEHMQAAIKSGAHAVAGGAIFQFTENTPKGAARYLSQHGIAARL